MVLSDPKDYGVYRFPWCGAVVIFRWLLNCDGCKPVCAWYKLVDVITWDVTEEFDVGTCVDALFLQVPNELFQCIDLGVVDLSEFHCVLDDCTDVREPVSNRHCTVDSAVVSAVVLQYLS